MKIADQTDDAIVFARAALELAATVQYTHSHLERIHELEDAMVKLGSTEMVLRPAVFSILRRQLAWIDTPEADRRRQEAAFARRSACPAQMSPMNC